MQKFSVQKNFDKELQELFREDGQYSKLCFDGTTTTVVSRKFAFIDNLQKNALLFIGLNPSRGEITQETNLYYSLKQMGDNEYSRYWNVFSNITELVNKENEMGSSNNLKWTHLDLLGVRETNQKLVHSLLKTQLGVDFIYKHLMISKKILENATPQIIVVSNTLARHFLGKEMSEDKKHNVWMGYEFIFDNNLGTHRIISEGGLKDVPVFFTSMLSGQRALDNGSKQRLIWHIKRVLEIIKNE